MSDPQVFPRMFAPTERDYREAVRSVVLNLQQKYGNNQRDIAQRVGITPKTVNNAQEMRNTLSGWAVIRILFEFGPEAIAPIMALGGAKAVTERPDDKRELAIREALKILKSAAGEES